MSFLCPTGPIVLAARFASVTDFLPWRFVSVSECFLITERVKWPSARVATGTLERVDGGDEMARYEHQLEIKGSSHVLNGRQARIDRGALEIGDLALPQADLPGKFGLAELLTQACCLQGFKQALFITNK
jgi:hypothetical protein